MANTTGTASNLEDLLAKISTYCTSTLGWTQGYLNTTNGWFELSKGNLSVSYKYVPGDPQHMSVHQAQAFAGVGIAPGKHTDDSGTGYNNVDTGFTNPNLLQERCVSQIGNGPFPSYYIYADTAANDYVHVVVEISSNIFRHFGFGIADKIGDWTGGEYAYGHHHSLGTNDPPLNNNHNMFWDGLSTNTLRNSTMRIVGLPNQEPSNYGAILSSSTTRTDEAGNDRSQIYGTFRTGLSMAFANFVGNTTGGFISGAPIEAYYRDPTNGQLWYNLGRLPDVRYVNIANIAPKEEVTIGLDTWQFFPMALKSLSTTTPNATFNGGIAYRKF